MQFAKQCNATAETIGTDETQLAINPLTPTVAIWVQL